jgi:Fe-S-cluster-containing dehydrogenase component
MKKYVLVIDDEACWGCKTCEVACKQENGAPVGVKLIAVMEDGPSGNGGKPAFCYRVNVCRHCEDPPCAAVCPAGAIGKRDDGIVFLDGEACTGCGACVDTCAERAIAFDEVKGTAAKCNLCRHRVDHGLIPACADNVCPAHCIYFGEPAEIRKAVAEKRKTRVTRHSELSSQNERTVT